MLNSSISFSTNPFSYRITTDSYKRNIFLKVLLNFLHLQLSSKKPGLHLQIRFQFIKLAF
ncbi:hypothetical protein BK139_21445 [Paenibacillus sp. FSL R5-0490]|nr:hypothetical protein BK139_21445 [Paenibacillus sp. FSL R5-0490]